MNATEKNTPRTSIRTSKIDYAFLTLVLLFFITPILLYFPSLDNVVLPKTVWIIVMTAILTAILLLQQERLPRSHDDIRTPLDMPMLWTLIAMALSLLVQRRLLGSSPAFQIVCLAVILVYLLVYLFRRHPQWISGCRLALLASGVVCALYVIIQDYGLDPLPWAGGVPDWRGRLPGTMGNPNAVAGFLAVILPTLVVQFYSAQGMLNRVLSALALLVVFMAMVVTFSVGAWMGIVFGGLLLVWILRKPEYRPMPWLVWGILIVAFFGLFLFGETSERRSFLLAPLRIFSFTGVRIALIAVLLFLAGYGCVLLRKRLEYSWKLILTPPLLLLAVVVFYFTPNPWNGRPGSILDQAMASDRWKTGAGARRFIWQTTALMVQDHPLFGIGFGRYFEIHARYQGELYTRRGTPHDRPSVGKVPQVHNEYYQQMAETGLVGTVPFFWLVLAIIALLPVAYHRSTREERGWTLAAIVGLAILMVHALSSFPLRRPETWLAGAFLLVQLIVRADPRPIQEHKEQRPLLSPMIRVVILLGLLFQVSWMVRPLISNIHLQQAIDSYRSPAEHWKHLHRAIAWDAQAFTPRMFAATSLFQNGRYEEAIAEAMQAIRAREDLDTRILISDAFHALGRYHEAALAWEDALRLNPCFPPFLLEAAQRHREAGNLEKAEGFLQRARELDPDGIFTKS